MYCITATANAMLTTGYLDYCYAYCFANATAMLTECGSTFCSVPRRFTCTFGGVCRSWIQITLYCAIQNVHHPARAKPVHNSQQSLEATHLHNLTFLSTASKPVEAGPALASLVRIDVRPHTALAPAVRGLRAVSPSVARRQRRRTRRRRHTAAFTLQTRSCTKPRNHPPQPTRRS
jgi:hypothetical protein